MKTKVKCGKCGTINENIEGKCKECGDFLYQYYRANRKKALYLKFLGGAVTIILFALLIFFAPKILLKSKTPPDPVKDDLISYLKQIKKENDSFSTSDAVINYNKYNLGILDTNDTNVILAELSLQEVPKYDSEDWKLYSKKVDLKAEALRKSKSLRERYQIILDYCQYKKNRYLTITPVTDTVESIHKHLIRQNELCEKAYESFITGMDLRLITNVKENKNGDTTWLMNPSRKEYSEDFKEYIEVSRNEEDTYPRMLEQAILKYDLLKEYKDAFPLKGWLKEYRLKQSSGE